MAIREHTWHPHLWEQNFTHTDSESQRCLGHPAWLSKYRIILSGWKDNPIHMAISQLGCISEQILSTCWYIWSCENSTLCVRRAQSPWGGWQLLYSLPSGSKAAHSEDCPECPCPRKSKYRGRSSAIPRHSRLEQKTRGKGRGCGAGAVGCALLAKICYQTQVLVTTVHMRPNKPNVGARSRESFIARTCKEMDGTWTPKLQSPQRVSAKPF